MENWWKTSWIFKDLYGKNTSSRKISLRTRKDTTQPEDVFFESEVGFENSERELNSVNLIIFQPSLLEDGSFSIHTSPSCWDIETSISRWKITT